MNQVPLYIAVMLLFIGSCKEPAPERKTVLAEFTPYFQAPQTLNGRVKSIRYRTYRATEVDGNIHKGDLFTPEERDSLNLPNDFNLYLNESGIVTRTEYITYEGETNHWETEIKDNRIIRATWFLQGDTAAYTTLRYDRKGKNIERFRYRAVVDTLIGRSSTTFYDNGNIKEVFLYNNRDELTGRRSYTWNEYGLVSEYTVYNPAGESIYQIKLSYNEKSMPVLASYGTPRRGTSKYEVREMACDPMGNQISSVIYKNGLLLSVNEITIDYY